MATKRVLFIDDQLDEWEDLLKEELGQFGFELKGEADFRNALDAISTYNPDIVLLDIMFPEGPKGQPTLLKIKNKHSALPVVILTGTQYDPKYKKDEYNLADYRYAKEGLKNGDFSQLAGKLDSIIEQYKKTKEGHSPFSDFGFIVGKTPAMAQVAEIIQGVAESNVTVLITGETGTGKELIAKAIHSSGNRARNPFVAINCGAIPENLLESELFGHTKGSFTGAIADKKGLFEVAEEGTIFLDEIGDLSLSLQVKLLRILQERRFKPVGSVTELVFKGRIIAATNKDLAEMIHERSFRDDLYFRLIGVEIHLPALRERADDIPDFFSFFVEKANKTENPKVKILTELRDDVKKLLTDYDWPGNIREMESIINRAVAIAGENVLQPGNFPEMLRKREKDNGIGANISLAVEKLFRNEISWDDIKIEFGAKGSLRKKFMQAIVDRWRKEYGSEPKGRELAKLLKITPVNFRRLCKLSDL